MAETNGLLNRHTRHSVSGVRISSSPLKSPNSLNYSELGDFAQKNGTETGLDFSSDGSIYEVLQELSERKKMRLFKPIAYVQYIPAKLTVGKDWFISYYVEDPLTNKLKRIRMKLNRIKSVSERKKAAKIIVANLNERLALGWNPLIEAKAPKGYGTLAEAFASFLKIKGKESEENTMRSYISFIKTFKGWLAKNGIKDSAYCVCVSREIALQFMNEIDEDIRMSAKTFNNYLSFFRSLFNWMRGKGYVNENPFNDIPKKAKRLTKKSRRMLTDSELERMCSFLGAKNPEFLAMCMLCYCCFMRPKEIVMLKTADIDLERQLVHVNPKVAKNDNDSYRTIPNDIIHLFRRLDYRHPDWYMFGENLGFQFDPSPIRLCSRKLSRYWGHVVRKECGFKMDVQFYSLKDTGITNMTESNVPINLVQQQADHSSLAMTSIYVGKKVEASEELKEVEILPKKVTV